MPRKLEVIKIQKELLLNKAKSTYIKTLGAVTITSEKKSDFYKDYFNLMKIKGDKETYEKNKIILYENNKKKLEDLGVEKISDFDGMVEIIDSYKFVLNEMDLNFKKCVEYLMTLVKTFKLLTPRATEEVKTFISQHSKQFPFEQVGPVIDTRAINEKNLCLEKIIVHFRLNQRFCNLQLIHVKIDQSFVQNEMNFSSIAELIETQTNLLTVIIELQHEDLNQESLAFTPSLLYLPKILHKVIQHKSIRNFVLFCKEALNVQLSDDIYTCLHDIIIKHDMFAIHLRNIVITSKILDGFAKSHSRYIGLESRYSDTSMFEKLCKAISTNTFLFLCFLSGFGVEKAILESQIKNLKAVNSMVIMSYIERLNLNTLNELEALVELKKA